MSKPSTPAADALFSDALFSDQWLTLREPADHLARDAQLAHAADRWLTQRATPARPLEARPLEARPFETRRTLVDLGCGSGSNPRYLAPRLHGAQHWRLIDHDAALLAQARLRCEPLTSADGQPIHLETRNLSLADAWKHGLQGADLVTASALFDLLTAADIEALADACRANDCAVLFALSVDGQIRFHDPSGTPLSSDDDRFMLAALQAHQQRDKGGGPAMGTQAPRHLRESFHRRGYHIREATTPWRLGSESLALAEALLAGWRTALHEQLPQQRSRVDRWHAQRLEGLMREKLTVTVGHRDLFATPIANAVPGAPE
ncbi:MULTISPECIES: class I SAM-dependent methyltransferase [Salinicola]|jgi:SAM-dependent methyltransferase|uniref:class I SAM-dependent methyltransferase n=1 Tax=Salinicola salarius TaxID=430457 RepID=UPI000B3FF6D4|nr:class I SAM-dependent methyltransferase [Salinicola salarius]